MKKFIKKHLNAIYIVLAILSLIIIYACTKTEIITPKYPQYIEYKYVVQRQKDSLFFYEIKGIQNGVILIDSLFIAKGTVTSSSYNF